jgi:hypothetical protein
VMRLLAASACPSMQWGLDLEQHGEAVPGAGGNPGRRNPGVQPQRHRRVPQVVRTATQRRLALRRGEGLLPGPLLLPLRGVLPERLVGGRLQRAGLDLVGGQPLRLHPVSRAEPGDRPEAGRRESVQDVLVSYQSVNSARSTVPGDEYAKSRSSAISTIATRTFRSPHKWMCRWCRHGSTNGTSMLPRLSPLGPPSGRCPPGPTS